MANKDHSLDKRIVKAAYEEFLSLGFKDASLHKIAENAGVTTGAIYTRYKNKDALFTSLLQDFIPTMNRLFAPAAQEYAKAAEVCTPEALLEAIAFEDQIYFRLLTGYYEECVLFFCRSDGSSTEQLLNAIMQSKTEQTVEFLSRCCAKKPNADSIRLLLGSQFWYFRQLLNARLDMDRTLECLKEILDFTDAGWKRLLEKLQ